MRFTEKVKEPLPPHYTTKNIQFDLPKIVDKLGQLEDIEDVLGIDLITLFKALKNGFYYSTDYEDELEEGFFKLNGVSMEVDFAEKTFSIERQIFFYFKYYGKTWALTKEELENGKEESLRTVFIYKKEKSK